MNNFKVGDKVKVHGFGTFGTYWYNGTIIDINSVSIIVRSKYGDRHEFPTMVCKLTKLELALQ